MAERNDRVALSPDGDRVAVRWHSGDPWRVIGTSPVVDVVPDLPDDWTYYTPATDRDVATEALDGCAEELRDIGDTLRWLRRRFPPVKEAAGGE